MIQWDIAFYSCIINPTPNKIEYCNSAIDGPLFCPGLQVDYWMTAHNDLNAIQSIVDIIIEDETGRNYTLGATGGKICWQAGDWIDFAGTVLECLEYPGFYNPTGLGPLIAVGNVGVSLNWYPDYVPMFFPTQLFDYPNEANPGILLALNGTFSCLSEYEYIFIPV